MANEPSPVEGPYDVHDMTVAATTAITQYSMGKLTDPRTWIIESGNGDVFAGIAMSEKTATDTSTQMGCAFGGIWLMTSAVSPTISAGALVSNSGPNLIKTATEAEIAAGKAIGKALEDIASSTTGEVKLLGF